MLHKDKEVLVTRYVREVLNHGNFEVLDEICAPEYKRYLSASSPPLTRDEQRQRLSTIRAAFTPWEVWIEEIICDGDVAAFRAVVRGRHTGAFLGLPATGRDFSISALDMVLIKDAQFVEHWGGPDLFSLVQHLGAKLVPDA